MPVTRMGLRPRRSETLPTIGTVTVEVSMYEVKGQANRSSPPRSAMMRGIATPITVWSIAERNIAMHSAPMITSFRRPGRRIMGGRSSYGRAGRGGGGGAGAVAAWSSVRGRRDRTRKNCSTRPPRAGASGPRQDTRAPAAPDPSRVAGDTCARRGCAHDGPA